MTACAHTAALGNAAAAVPEEVLLDRELTRTGSTLSSNLSSRSSGAPKYAISLAMHSMMKDSVWMQSI